jgi:hypothetical protein
MTRDVHSKDAAPPDRCVGQDSPRAGSAMPALLILQRGHRLQDPLTKGQRRPRGPRDTTGGDVASSAVMMVASAHHLITPASVTGCPQPDLGNAPLTGCAVLLTRATQGRREVALLIRDVGPDGQDQR